MKTVRVQVPGTCGELIQGRYGDGEQLVSYAIDRYARAEITAGRMEEAGRPYLPPKAGQAIDVVCDYLKVPREGFSIRLSSDLPVGKGMASSTADIVAVLQGVASWFGVSLTEQELGALAVKVEPSDSIMFRKWTRFDHIHGVSWEQFDPFDRLNVYVLEMNTIVNTKRLRASGVFEHVEKPAHSQALTLLRQACKQGDSVLLGKAMTCSALENQALLCKPHLEELIDLALQSGFVGVNAAHSGTVLGCVYEGESVDVQRFESIGVEKGWLQPYPKRYIHRLVTGGAVVEII